MLLGISMIGTSEAMNLGKKLGLEPKLLAKILNTSSGRCWSSEVYNPCPGVLDGVPSSNNYQGGFGTALMTKVNELNKRKAEVEDVDRSEHSKFETSLKKIKHQIILLKNEVDNRTENLETELFKKWEGLHLCTEKEGKDVSLLIGSLESKKSEVEDIIPTNDAKRIFVNGLG
ncbi:HIBADH [Mytilus coruscus]|uniref:HIBADH n=1 Tax=Mytilus coruscus TaxID=42192 RepID=A0A6J7ZYK0_MYTCO|nr:HIBADH [Mytilus coruscus]